MRYLYLHGFASSPASRKAQAFFRAFERQNLKLDIPSLDCADFEHLTLTHQLEVVEKVMDGDPCRIIGSSMGGYLAAIYAERHPETERIVLMAPALNFFHRWREMQGTAAIEQWRESGWLEVFHYGEKAMRRVHYGLLEDAERFPASPDFKQPALIFHGRNDSVVPISLSRVFAASHPNAMLTEMDSDHELTDVLDEIIEASMPFLTDH